MRAMLPSESVITHIYDGVEYQILPDLNFELEEDFEHLVVIGSFPHGRYRQPISVSKILMGEPNYLDWLCGECKTAMEIRLLRNYYTK